MTAQPAVVPQGNFSFIKDPIEARTFLHLLHFVQAYDHFCIFMMADYLLYATSRFEGAERMDEINTIVQAMKLETDLDRRQMATAAMIAMDISEGDREPTDWNPYPSKPGEIVRTVVAIDNPLVLSPEDQTWVTEYIAQEWKS